MEDSDDELSYVSASDSELETDTWSNTYSVYAFPSTSAAVKGRSSSSTSLCSFRRRKRPAPQPPISNSSFLPDSGNTQTSKMSTFVQAFQKGNNSGDATPVDGCHIEKKPICNFVSHPIRLVTSDETSVAPLSGSMEKETVAANYRRPGFLPPRNLANLQIKLIDDVLDPLSQSLPLSPSPSPTPFAYPSRSFPGNIPYPPLSNIYGTLTNAGRKGADQFVTQRSPLYVTSVVHPDGGGLVPISMQPQVAEYALPGTSPYVPVAPLTYVSPMPPSQSLFTSSAASGAPLIKERTVPHTLAHSASDPGVDGVLKAGLVLSPLTHQSSLDRVSERDENVDGEDYEEVCVGEQETTCELILNSDSKKYRRAERADSISFPHLYEEIFVSRRLNLRVTFTNLTMVVIVAAFLLPNSASILYSFFRLVFGTLFPAYYSYKAVRTKNVKEYVKWMMYWIVFAFFTCAETITDVFLSFWFPFYYELKILVVLWLLSPATRGSSILYRKFVHPWLIKREEEIDDCIAKAKQQGYTTVVQLGTKGVNYATSVIMQTAIKGGGGLVNQLKRSYSTSEIGEDTADMNRNVKVLPSKQLIHSPSEEEDIMSVSSGSYESEPRHRTESESSSNRPRGHSTGRSARTAKTRSADVSELYFHDASDSVPAPAPAPIAQRRSPRTHDAGRTADGGGHVTRRSRSGEVPYATLPRTSKRATVKKKQT